ncbi:hypothetical protein BGZ61DRAFT_451461 [Ilyonectria robusta]|uniref:uncharacterized protein n=1 Tax=Ilyonectria robusta TaxID=1079257 RepID=UPI001E8EF139|nr:uncharacterized protein BGZ61DRAFT_451461 [Ilyonectria robusta]KAH8699862.1 hypothetical protein BGZ61DRAFT_451461 [Ilyonectria robusta]
MGGRTDEASCTDLEETRGELCGAGEATLYEYAYALNTTSVGPQWRDYSDGAAHTGEPKRPGRPAL